MDNTYTPPKLGTVHADLVPPPHAGAQRDARVWVTVRVFKFDTIRQEAYWVTKSARSFKNTALAQAYMQRINQQNT